jgi:hypothetical protein
VDGVSLGEQALQRMTADKARASGEEDFHAEDCRTSP